MFAAVDIISPSKGTLYAPKGAELTISHYSGNVVFCSWNGGQKFPCHKDKLCDVRPKDEPAKKKYTAKEQELINEYERSIR